MKNNNRPWKPKASTPSIGKRQDSGDSSQWQRRYEHYRDLAQHPGALDHVAREQYWQHAEHYCRLMNGSAT